jgi:hypothetical protein
MRMRFAVIVVALLMCTSVFAAEKPTMDIAVYPGGASTMEINLTNEDLLPTIKAMLPMVKLGGMEDKIDLNDLDAALKDVKRVEVLQLDIKKGATDSQIADYYAKNAPAGDWNRVFWQNLPSMGTMAVYVAGGGEQLYAFRVASAVVDGKTIKRVFIVRTEGKIDFMKVLTMAGKVFMK